jgi:phasin family protein
MIKAEEMQQYGKEQFDTAVASASTFQKGFQAIATTVGDYTKKSFEDGSAFVQKLAGMKSLDKAIEAQTEYAKSAHESFVAESQKVAELYADLARQAFKPLEGLAARMTPTR